MFNHDICVSPEQIRTLLGVGWWDWSVYICFVVKNLSVFPLQNQISGKNPASTAGAYQDQCQLYP